MTKKGERKTESERDRQIDHLTDRVKNFLSLSSLRIIKIAYEQHYYALLTVFQKCKILLFLQFFKLVFLILRYSKAHTR